MSVYDIFPFLGKQWVMYAWPNVSSILITIAPIFLVFTLFVIFWDLWILYIRSKNFLSIKYIVLELKLPRDTYKSPAAMEVVLNAIHNTADGSKYNQYWSGDVRPWYSLELISIEGQVKFMIWIDEKRKAGIMGALYSQYPGIEIIEREDYAKSVHFDPKEMKLWGVEFKFTKKDCYPIKTYIDYGLDKDPKEEYKIDPLSPLIEFLGNVKPNQQIWIQIMIRAHKNDQKIGGTLSKTEDKWKREAQEEINKILSRDPKSKVAGFKDKEGKNQMVTITEGERDVVNAIERSITKYAFDVGIRALYITSKDAFDGPFGIGGIIGGMKHFSSDNLNGFRPNGDAWHSRLGYPWSDYKKIRANRYSRLVLAAYKRRSFFYPPFQGESVVMNTEELATLYHFPGQVAASPGLARIPSKKAEAPGNLPI